MDTFYDRLLQEKTELVERIHKLDSFLSSDKADDLEPVHKALLKVQSQIMYAYEQVLVERIALLQPVAR